MLRKKAIVAVCGVLLFPVTGYAQDTLIRPFKVKVSEESLDELRWRVAATQWPDKETVADQSQGVPLSTLRSLEQKGRAKVALIFPVSLPLFSLVTNRPAVRS